MIISKKLHCSDIGNAERLVSNFAGTIRYCNTTKSWYFWDNTVWRRDDIQRINVFAIETAKKIYKEVSEEQNEDRRAELKNWARKSESYQNRRNMVQSAQALVSITAEQWNSDPNLFNCLNGTLELDTLVFREHRKEDNITKISAVNYNRQASCPLGEEHLSLVFDGDRELIEAFQMICGYTLLADNPEQVFFLLYGTGKNGKTVTQNVISRIFEDYASNVSPDTLMVHSTPGGSP